MFTGAYPRFQKMGVLFALILGISNGSFTYSQLIIWRSEYSPQISLPINDSASIKQFEDGFPIYNIDTNYIVRWGCYELQVSNQFVGKGLAKVSIVEESGAINTMLICPIIPDSADYENIDLVADSIGPIVDERQDLYIKYYQGKEPVINKERQKVFLLGTKNRYTVQLNIEEYNDCLFLRSFTATTIRVIPTMYPINERPWDLDQYLTPGLRFKFNNISFRLQPMDTCFAECYSTLDSIAQWMKTGPRYRIEIGIHSDSRHHDMFSRHYSGIRAQHLKNYLIRQGVEPNRVEIRGYEDKVPLYSDAFITSQPTRELQEYYHRLNRRVEIKIIPYRE